MRMADGADRPAGSAGSPSDPELGPDTAPAESKRNRGGRPRREESRKRKSKAAVERLHDKLPQLLDKIVDKILAADTPASVNPQLVLSLERLAALLPNDLTMSMAEDGIDWAALAVEAMEVSAADRLERETLRTELAQLKGERPPDPGSERLRVRLAVAESKPAGVDLKRVIIEPAPEVTPKPSTQPVEQVFRGTLAEIAAEMDHGRLPSNNPRRWQRKEY